MGKKAELHALKEQQAKIEQKWVHRGRFIQIRHDTIMMEEPPPKIWDIIVHPGAVAIIPIDNQGRFVLVEQWRRAIEKITIELPAGLLEQGEDPITCAQRELQEETGFRAGQIIPFGGCYSAPGISTEYIHLFLAKDLEKKPLHADDTDGIDVRAVSVEEALKLIKEGQICDAKTVLGILRYLQSS